MNMSPMESVVDLIGKLTILVQSIQRQSMENDKALLALTKELIEKVIKVEERIASIEEEQDAD